MISNHYCIFNQTNEFESSEAPTLKGGGAFTNRLSDKRVLKRMNGGGGDVRVDGNIFSYK